jgi:sortase A
MIAVSAVGIGHAVNSIPDPGWSITPITPTTNLEDAQSVVLNVKARPDVKIFELQLRECRADTTYTVDEDVEFATGKCPNSPLSSSSDLLVRRTSSSGLIEATQLDAGTNFTFRVGAGTVPLGTGGTLTCDETHPCVLVAKLSLAGPVTSYLTIPLTFIAADPLAGCGGAAPGAISSAGSDQMKEAWASWTVASCKQPGAVGAATRGNFGGEGDAVKLFAGGQVDLAYTSAGYNADVGLLPADVPHRNAVATPLALNAAVIAVGGGFVSPFGEKVPYTQPRLTAADAAALFSGGVSWVLRDDKPYKASILNSNPELGGTLFAQVPISRPMAPSEAESSSWYMTHFFGVRAPADWLVPFTTTPRAASAAMATAQPPFESGTLDLFSGRPALAKVINTAAASISNGPIWVMTDLVTAKALGMTPVAIQNANGVYVEPTEASLAAAVSTMKRDANGLLQPDPLATAQSATAGSTSVKAQTTVQPYPLTYVEYAMSPAEPLVDTSCAVQAGSQRLLANWLVYLLGDGQKNLPAGMVALPPALLTDAAATVGQVGASPVTGACAQQVTGSVAPPPGGSDIGFSSGSLPAGSIPKFSVPSAGASTSPASGTTGSTKAPAETIAAVPAFAGHDIADPTGAVVALAGIVLVVSLGAWLTAGGQTAGGAGPAASSTPLTPRRVGSLVLLWAAIGVTAVALVVFQLGPTLAQRDQRELLANYRVAVSRAANESQGLAGVSVATTPPEHGSAVGILEIGALRTQDVVLEGATSSQTLEGPGHVPGTAGLGQPGNSVVVARRNGYGGSFRELAQLHRGDRIVVTTTQGQTVYSVRTVDEKTIVNNGATDASASTPTSTSTSAGPSTTTASSTSTSSAKSTTTSAAPTATSAPSGTTEQAGTHKTKAVKLDALYGPTSDDRLTLVTSASRVPWNHSDAVIVTAHLVGKPYRPTPQGARSADETGLHGDSSQAAAAVLALLALAGAIAASVFVYRKMRFRIAYLITIAPLVALTVVAGQTVSRLLPAWM